MITRSVSLERIGVTEIGLKSECVAGCETFGIGRIQEDFHWRGTCECERDKLRSLASGPAMTGAESLRNQAGIPSRPVAVSLSLSRI